MKEKSVSSKGRDREEGRYHGVYMADYMTAGRTGGASSTYLRDQFTHRETTCYLSAKMYHILDA